MGSFFATYDLLSRSGLFDPSYYVSSDPDLLKGTDPLAHYIEVGAAERRNPSPSFDTGYYLEQCEAAGLVPENPLLHFIQHGSQLGFSTQRPSSSGAAVDTRPPVTASQDKISEATPTESSVQISIEAPAIANGAAT